MDSHYKYDSFCSGVYAAKSLKKFFAISGLLGQSECTKFVLRRGSAPDSAGETYDAPLVGWGGGYPFPFLLLTGHLHISKF